MDQALSVAVGVLTFNRFHLLQRTLASLRANAGFPFDLVLVDGGSASPAQREYVQAQGGECLAIPTVGESMNVVVDRCLGFEPDLVIFSADDYEYKPRWLARLVAFWQAAPADVALCSLNWEPAYSWNQVLDVVQVAGERALLRATVPGSSWSFWAADWPRIGPLPHVTGGEDLAVCRLLQTAGRRLAALDLSDHIGARESAWGNRSWTVAKPLIL